ncbi:nicotinate (nicotinamide) nucleotide adenylyltransferase [Kordiimonas sp. SCSIO 12610]|uniref:nicotinate (nicotinamide) nucleotide adenylyltransferase n=1 Tax=Kordiimonas sp. SCSIO 12610 TaxID=2829597 RepID=UPI00210D72EC|nr:nicotinate (nicotinamide) nucleotide adenylyltransferase [Kordiimonas sp. SCSIO 12610]UTW55828.1 nicotinate (nicotinamide) nucleotide adenylyltransferase [Kordiimonas sp. SCSIO 12610]
MKVPKPSFATQKVAAKWRRQRIGLYGGSFNPFHEGHMHVAEHALKHLPIDSLWFLVSPGNPQKEGMQMASLKKRMKRARRNTETNAKMHVSKIEKKLGTRYSADTITSLQRGMPNTDFVWIMGADNLATFHTWERWSQIAEAIPIAIFDRPGYGWTGLKSKFCLRYSKNRVAAKNIFNSGRPAWTFVTIPRHPANATEIRAEKLAKKAKKAKATNAKET